MFIVSSCILTTSFDPDKINNGVSKPLLSEYLFPETFGCRLDAQDKKFIPVHVDNHGSLTKPRLFLNGNLLDDLEMWTRFFEPLELEVVFQRPEQALYLMPELVIADLDRSGHKTLYFFKRYRLAAEIPITRELAVHKKVHDAKLGSDVCVSQLQGVVHIQDEVEDATLGLLLSLIDHEEGMTLQSTLQDDPPRHLRERWAKQDGNAWVIDFDGGYTEGWVDKGKAGTKEGDLQGLAKILDRIFKRPTERSHVLPVPGSSHQLGGYERDGTEKGASRGIGLELAKKLKARGYEVYGTVRSLTKDESELDPLGYIATGILEIDVLKEETVQAAASAWDDKPLDLLINAAGHGDWPIDWEDHTADDSMVKFQTNAVGPLLIIKHFYQALQKSKQGKVINLSSKMAPMWSLLHTRWSESLGYRLSRTALIQLTVSLGREFQSDQSSVTVNAIHPGRIPITSSDEVELDDLDDMDTQTSLMVKTIEAFGPEDTGRYVNAWGEDMPW
ncbi:hypothetical protein F5883DRAFT_641712 [Diaporthe sp. PMI_573]|nr:hypothetical protein F5883DRAFT_641712 [Diaporthaceae sp. PMI_573]